jgi:hypothetical protein
MPLGDMADLLPYIEQLSQKELEELFASISDYDEIPVGIDEFLDSEKYLGGYFQGQVYPYWRDVLREIYPSPLYSPYWLIALRGCIGAGKTTIASVGTVYDLYRLLCMQSPQATYGLLPSTRILFAIFNVTMSLTHDVVWDKISQMLASSPYFSKLTYQIVGRKKRGDSMFPKNLDFFMGSRIGHTLGKAVYGAILSEANFEIVENQVYDTFNSLLRRMESRFMTPGGGVPGKIWVDSSETDKFSVVNKVVDGYKLKNGVYVSQAPLWEVQPHRYGPKRFWVFKGSEVRQPEVLPENATLFKTEPSSCIEVPVEHRDAFEADINAALRDLAGVPVVASYKLFRLKDKLHKAFTISPLFPEVITLDFDEDTDQILNYATATNYFANPLNKHIPRHIHIDIGLTGDRLGIASTYVVNYKERKSKDINTFEEVTESIPELVCEWAIGVEPTPGKQNPLFKIRMFLLQIQNMGYPIGGVSFDGFQSADSIQQLQKMGIEAELISVDRTTVPYFSLRSAIYEGRMIMPKHSVLTLELEDLEVSTDSKHIDHPKKNANGKEGSKDISDAVCGSYFGAEKNAHKHKLFLLAQYENDKNLHAGKGQVAAMFWPNA